jgi:hypothetical protein
MNINDVLEIIKKTGIEGMDLNVVDGQIVVEVPERLNEFLHLKQIRKRFDEVDSSVIKENYRILTSEHNLTAEKVASLLDIKVGTARLMSQSSHKGKPSLFNLLMIATYLSIDAMDFFAEPDEEEGEKNEVSVDGRARASEKATPLQKPTNPIYYSDRR